MRSNDVKKYIFIDGVMKINPEWQKQQGINPTNKQESLAVVSSTADISDATQAQLQATGAPMRLADTTVASMEIIQDKDFHQKFQAPVDGGEILDGISNAFARYEIPVGLLNKLLALSEYHLNFIIDDSGSMVSKTDALCKDGGPFMSQVLKNQSGPMTRWQEVEDRLHVMMELLAYIPSNSITIHFLNRSDHLVLTHTKKTPDQFAQEAHAKISELFRKGPNGGTPLFSKLREAFTSTQSPTMHYLFTDGEPSDATIEDLSKLILSRSNPQMNPLTLMSCTNEDATWMKEIEEQAPFVSELDDFDSERKEVLHDQGPKFPFNKGFWLLCQLVASINPDDLDAMDESLPFSKMTLDNLMGRRLTPEEYRLYFDSNPNSRKYQNLYQEFSREDTTAKKILGHLGPQPNAGYMPYNSSYGFINNMNHSQPRNEEQKWAGPKMY